MKKFFYRVTEKDTIILLSQKFSLPVFSLIRENNLNAEIKCGDILFVEKKEKIYRVKPLDTIESVAKKLGVSVQRILDLNGNIPYIFYGLIINY